MCEGVHWSAIQGGEPNMSLRREAERPTYCEECYGESIKNVWVQNILFRRVSEFDWDLSFGIDQCLLSYWVNETYKEGRVFGEYL